VVKGNISKSPLEDTGGEIHICLQNGERRSGEVEEQRENNHIVGFVN